MYNLKLHFFQGLNLFGWHKTTNLLLMQLTELKVRSKALSLAIMTSLLFTQIFHTISKAKKTSKTKQKQKQKKIEETY